MHPTRLRAVALLLALFVAACATTSTGRSTPSPTAASSASAVPSASAAVFPVTILDDEGTEVVIESEPDVVVSLTPAITETLFALGVGDRIAGRAEDPVLYPPEAAVIPEVARFDAVDLEQIVAFEPDVVFAGGNAFTPPAAIEQMRSLGLDVIVLYAPTVDAVFHDLEVVGDAVGRGAEADAIVELNRVGFAGVVDAVADLPRPRVFYELDATGAIYGPADESFVAEMIGSAGGEAVTTGSPLKFDISLERLIEADPEVILLADAQFGVSPEEVAARPGWDVIRAVRDGHVRPIDDQTVTRPGPRLFNGLELLASTIHPDASIPRSSPIPAVP